MFNITAKIDDSLGIANPCDSLIRDPLNTDALIF